MLLHGGTAKMGLRHRYLTYLLTATLLATTVLPPQVAQAGWPFNRAAAMTTVQQLALQIDKLQKHLDQYGTIVAKSPDVWGEARLTKYRREYEQVLAGEKTKFTTTINAAISRSDQAYLSHAMALQAAISGEAAFSSLPQSTVSERTEETVAYGPDGQVLRDNLGNPIVVVNTQPTVVDSVQRTPLTIPALRPTHSVARASRRASWCGSKASQASRTGRSHWSRRSRSIRCRGT
ncbi:MAG: hypothetical protein R3B90_04710 [Planctomycetaceae bacterium]